MSPLRRILKHVSVFTAARRRKCHRNPKEHSITKGQAFLLIKEQGQGNKNYCRVCARPILRQAQDDLHRLTTDLYHRENTEMTEQTNLEPSKIAELVEELRSLLKEWPDADQINRAHAVVEAWTDVEI